MATILADSFLAEADLDELEEIDDVNLVDMKAINYDHLESGVKLEDDDPGYRQIVNCNALSADIENEIVIIHNFIRDKYRLKFPELESLIHHPIDYARVVKKIGNEMDLTLIDLKGLLPKKIIIIVSTIASTTGGKPLPEPVLQKTIDACDRALALDSAKIRVLEFVESRMGIIAPNLSAIVGSAVAAKLMGTAGGLSALSRMPACDVKLLGAKKRTLAGFSTATTSRFHVGYIEQTEIFQTTPPDLRSRVFRLLASKVTLAARIDSAGSHPSGSAGRILKDEIIKKIEKLQEPPPARRPKPLPVHNLAPMRGGRRLRKLKERYGITEMRKLTNRMQFGVAEESSLGDGYGEGYGMLGQAGSGKLRRVSVGRSKLAAKVANKFKKQRNYGSSGFISGLTSSLAFTPLQGFELLNPQAHEHTNFD
ncbi:hypothetical protein COLO4_32664 [Corchorus olitorius]|uniref:Nop domain-containing protein n=1 Tax=Corchorus olitorius TaxID=93759 RepID=A0A1R3GYX1_9ROSI|nr:hypothetical protein COLO4_32664 [Corchorus olitorius]